jgi:indolepyruvate ferredoxin oxidoreductase beta subunit
VSNQSNGLLLAGVGGQGVILASMIVADALVRAGHDVKQSEVHGMAQRGGSVVSHIRWGAEVSSPLVPKASARVLAAFEWAEGLRWIDYVRPGGAVVVDVRMIVPPGACVDRRGWATSYPRIDDAVIVDRRLRPRLLNAAAISAGLGNVRAANSVILGAVAGFLDIEDKHWEAAIETLVPRGTAEINLAAFAAGKDAADAVIPAPELPPSAIAGPHQIEIKHDWCKACDICSRVCPEYCLALTLDGKLAIVDAEGCTGCRLCEMLCPDFAIRIHPPVGAGIGQPVGGGS